MRLGVCTTDFAPMGVEDLFARVRALGFEAVQFSFASVLESDFTAAGDLEIPPAIRDGTVEQIRRSAQRYGLSIVAVNGTYNMAHPDRAVREEGVRRFEVLADAVMELGCPVISLCTGTRNRDSLWRPHPDNGTPEAWSDMMEGMRALLAIAGRRGLTLAVETEASNVVDSPEKARRLLEACASPALKMIIDCANLFHAGQAHPQNVRPIIARAFEQFGADIALAHGKDIAESEGIDFCPTGQGIVDYPFFLEKLAEWGYSGDMLLHGIYDGQAMARAVSLMRGLLAER